MQAGEKKPLLSVRAWQMGGKCMKNNKKESNSKRNVPARQVRDVSNRDILKDPVL